MEYQYIVNPKTNRKCSVNSKQGQQIINNYVQLGGCGGCSVSSASNPILSGGSRYNGSSNSVNYLLLGGAGQCGYNSKTNRCGKKYTENTDLCEVNPATGYCRVKSTKSAKTVSKPVSKAPSPKPVAKPASPKAATPKADPNLLARRRLEPLPDDTPVAPRPSPIKGFERVSALKPVTKPVARAASPKPAADGWTSLADFVPKADPKPKLPSYLLARKGWEPLPDDTPAATPKPVAPVAAPKKRGPTGPRPVKERAELSVSAKGTTRERCERQSTAKYTKRPSPPYPATACCVAKEFVKVGKGGQEYYAKQAKDGSCRWVQCKPEYPGCP